MKFNIVEIERINSYLEKTKGEDIDNKKKLIIDEVAKRLYSFIDYKERESGEIDYRVKEAKELISILYEQRPL